jgi:hypothetical protein
MVDCQCDSRLKDLLFPFQFFRKTGAFIYDRILGIS